MSWWEALSLFGQGALSAVWPVANAELLVSAWSVRADSAWALTLGTIAFSVGHTLGKCALFAVVRYEVRLPKGGGRIARELRKAEERLDRTVYRLNWSPLAKTVNSAAVCLLALFAPWWASTPFLLALIAIKAWSWSRLREGQELTPA